MSENIYIIIGNWLIVILAVERTTEIISDSKLFFPLRAFLAKRAISDGTHNSIYKLFFAFFYNIVSCAWCLSVWVSLFFCWFLPGDYFLITASGNILVKWLGLVGVANWWHAIFRLTHRGRVLTVDVKHTIESVDELEKLGIVIGGDDGEHTEGDSEEADGTK